MISVIMPSFLGLYRYAATDRPQKLIRAIDSVLDQTYEDWELMVVSDGCVETVEILKKNYDDPRIRGLKIDKKPNFSGIPRNTGIAFAKGDIICYLDIDDMFGKDHLKKIAEGFNGYDWVWFWDRSYDVKKKRGGFIPEPLFEDFHVHESDINARGKCGTSNVAHRRSINAFWRAEPTYMHDWVFINVLKGMSKNYAFIGDSEYLICHVPNLLDI